MYLPVTHRIPRESNQFHEKVFSFMEGDLTSEANAKSSLNVRSEPFHKNGASKSQLLCRIIKELALLNHRKLMLSGP